MKRDHTMSASAKPPMSQHSKSMLNTSLSSRTKSNFTTTLPSRSTTTTTTTKAEKRKVRAVTRIRPFFAFDSKSTGTASSSSTELESCVIPIPPNKIGFQQQKYCEIIQQTFNFDAVYDTNSTQEAIFQNEVEHLMDHTFNGKKCTIFCYGPTGSGKTFTSFGEADNLGIMGRTIELALSMSRLKKMAKNPSQSRYQCHIKLSSLEIYNEKCYDLLSRDNTLNRKGLNVCQVGTDIVVQGLSKREIVSMEQFHQIYLSSIKQRKTAFTALNAHSSRSHAIYTVYIEQTISINSKIRRISGKLSIADLAGSENNKRTENTGERMTESKNINKSLLALGSVIDALNKNKRPPYRDSVLTRLLSDCLGGDSISTMICCVSGLLDDSSMTRRCLEFGSNTRKIENKVIAHIKDKEKENKEGVMTSREREGRSQKKKKEKVKNTSFNRGSGRSSASAPGSGSVSSTTSSRQRKRKHHRGGNTEMDRNLKRTLKKKENQKEARDGNHGRNEGDDHDRKSKEEMHQKKRTLTISTISNASVASTSSNLDDIQIADETKQNYCTQSLKSIGIKGSPQRIRKKRKYSLQPTPSKFITVDSLEKHGDEQRNRMMKFSLIAIN